MDMDAPRMIRIEEFIENWKERVPELGSTPHLLTENDMAKAVVVSFHFWNELMEELEELRDANEKLGLKVKSLNERLENRD